MQSNEDIFLDLTPDENDEQEDDNSCSEFSPKQAFNLSARRKIERFWEEKELIEQTRDVFTSWM